MSETSRGKPRELRGDINVPLKVFADKPERSAHKEKIGDELVARYIKDTDYEDQTLDEMVRSISGAQSEKEAADMLKALGISKDKSGRFNLKNPERPDVPGSWEKEDRLKALLAGMAGAKNAGEQLQAIAKAYEYMGLPFHAAYELSPKEKKAPVLPLNTWKKVLGAGRAAAFAAGLLALASPHAARFGGESRGSDENAPVELGGAQGFAGEREARAEDTSKKEAAGRLYTLKEGDRIWNITANILKAQLGRKPANAEIMLAAKAVCEQNGIRDKDLGVSGGAFDSKRLRPGAQIDLSAAYETAEALKAKS